MSQKVVFHSVLECQVLKDVLMTLRNTKSYEDTTENFGKGGEIYSEKTLSFGVNSNYIFSDQNKVFSLVLVRDKMGKSVYKEP